MILGLKKKQNRRDQFIRGRAIANESSLDHRKKEFS